MNSLLLNIKNLIPYLLLIFLYFLFVNIEARKELRDYSNNNRSIKTIDEKTNIQNKNIRISIPVIPYKK